MTEPAKQKPYDRIKRYILVTMIVLPAVFFFCSMGIGYFYFATSLTRTTGETMRRVAIDHAQMVTAFLNERLTDLRLVAAAYGFEHLSRRSALAEVHDLLVAKSNAFADLGVFDVAGTHVAYYGPYRLSGKRYGEETWFKDVVNKGYYISDVFLGYRQVPHFIIAVATGPASAKWVLRATIDTAFFSHLVDQVRLGQSGEAYILNGDGLFQSTRRSGGKLMQPDPDFGPQAVLNNDARAFVATGPNNPRYLYATAWMGYPAWLLVVRQEKADAYSTLRQAAYAIMLVAGFGGVVIIFSAFYMTARIVTRIRETDQARNQLQEQLIRAARLAEIGETSAGFAHEINNPLQIMKSEQALIVAILEDLKKNSTCAGSRDLADLTESMAQIGKQIDRCARVTQAILKFGRKSTPKIEPLRISQFIPEVIAMVENRALVHGIRIEQAISPRLAAVAGDATQLQQVFLNLLNNALDAIIARHGSFGGLLKIEAAVNDAQQVFISVSDNGVGITDDNLKKIFTPFFTTKPVGQGTGLGLSICYGIINDLGGSLEVISKPGSGTSVRVSLPLAPAQKSAKRAGRQSAMAAEMTTASKGEKNGSDATAAGR